MSSEEAEDEQDTVEWYIEKFKVDAAKIEEYRKISNMNRKVSKIFLILIPTFTFVSTLLLFLDIDFAIGNQTVSVYGLAAVLFFIISAIGFLIIRFTSGIRSSHDLNRRAVTRHNLALALEAYQDSEWEETMNLLGSVRDEFEKIAHPQYASFVSHIISNKHSADPNEVQTIVDNFVIHMVETDQRSYVMKREVDSIIEPKDSRAEVQYRDIITDAISDRISQRQIQTGVSLIAIAVIIVVFYFVSEQLALLFAALATLIPPIFNRD